MDHQPCLSGFETLSWLLNSSPSNIWITCSQFCLHFLLSQVFTPFVFQSYRYKQGYCSLVSLKKSCPFSCRTSTTKKKEHIGFVFSSYINYIVLTDDELPRNILWIAACFCSSLPPEKILSQIWRDGWALKSLVFSIHHSGQLSTLWNYTFLVSDMTFWPLRAPAVIRCTYRQTDVHTYPQIKRNKIKRSSDFYQSPIEACFVLPQAPSSCQRPSLHC